MNLELLPLTDGAYDGHVGGAAGDEAARDGVLARVRQVVPVDTDLVHHDVLDLIAVGLVAEVHPD